MMRLIIGSVGSSPLTRGTLTITTEQDETVSVHPRLRGELSAGALDSTYHVGSSPLTRGTHQRGSLIQLSDRFIPAYAGNSLKMVTTLH